jgi:hypothetical protein
VDAGRFAGRELHLLVVDLNVKWRMKGTRNPQEPHPNRHIYNQEHKNKNDAAVDTRRGIGVHGVDDLKGNTNR